MHDLFYVGACALCGDRVESDDGSTFGILIRRWHDGDVTVEHTACTAKEMRVSERRLEENHPLGYMSDKQAAAYIDGLMEDAYTRATSYDVDGFARNH